MTLSCLDGARAFDLRQPTASSEFEGCAKPEFTRCRRFKILRETGHIFFAMFLALHIGVQHYTDATLKTQYLCSGPFRHFRGIAEVAIDASAGLAC